VPLAAVLLLASAYLAQQRQTQTQRAALELARALATAVDAELRSTFILLQSLGTSAELEDLHIPQLSGPRFAPVARRAIESQGWRSVIVADARGKVVMRAPDGGNASPLPVEPESMAQVVGSRVSMIGQVAKGPSGRDGFAVRVPVLKGDQLRYVLSAVVPTDTILDVVARQQLAPSWVVAVYDQAGHRVARSKATTSPRYSSSLEALVRAGGQQGMGTTRTLEGVESHTGFSRVMASQWVVAVGIPAAEANADLYRLLAAVGAGTAASLGLLAWLAWRAARGISGPIHELKRAASALGAGGQVELPSMGMEELDEVAQALRQAGNERDEANSRRTIVETERQQLLARVEQALRVAEAANRNKDEFLALLGHELRNPLAPIMNAVHLMGLKGDSGTAHERSIIERQLTYVTRLVDDLLDASRITSNRLVINLRPLRPVPVLEQTLETLGPMVGARKLTLDIPAGVHSLWVRADEGRLVQVFNNLLGNAIKFTRPEGSIGVRVGTRDQSIQFEISDDGAGMGPDELDRAFDLFYQAPNRSRGVSGGLGLGLAIVKSLIDMHAGSVSARSAGPGKGSSITFTLPVTEPLREDPTIPGVHAGVASINVLVVDDNKDAADTLAALLGMSGFVVRVAYTAESALEVVQAFAPRIGVLDIGLPGMDGYELARRLRAQVAHSNCKLIALTGYGQEKDVKTALSAGFDAHLTKPVEPDALLRLMASLVPAAEPPG
jgi:signal transduction histidine kinase/ActR/RegA family two-component response regulator